ncbi:MAG: bifunctional phosphopantothenoylcysteine decarboxylase/phosphopantothenate--cysteine ligase CoaBC [Deltaproteobacteria bacterium]|nr:bifunctional phosphopantothenoylcysteine decarboxylase/phosphopantothenate--cysteine ligase CoaBC [Deltaproteobacteria bacterium]
MTLNGRRVLLGVTGGIAAYKAAELVRLLQKEGAVVRAMMTAAAGEFVCPLTFRALTQAPVGLSLFDPAEQSPIGHIALARETDCIVIAPATANFLAKLAWGLADDLPSTVVLASRAPLVLAPAMNTVMWQSPATQENVARLAARAGVSIVPPGEGEMACQEVGAGRLAELEAIVEAVAAAVSPHDLDGLRLLVTSGPTHEPLDPVRFLANRSTGRMGHALARVACRRGAAVTLVRGPVELADPPGMKVVAVQTARQMHEAVLAHAPSVDVLIMVAAVGDARPAAPGVRKLRKSELPGLLPLQQNPDILADLGERGIPPLRVGFAAETEEGVAAGLAKLRAKRCHLLAVNRVDRPGCGFAAATNEVVLLDGQGGHELIALAAKEVVASRILDRVAELARASGLLRAERPEGERLERLDG